MVNSDIEQILQAGCTELGLELTPTQHLQLVNYLDLFIKWSGAYNLSAIRQPEQMVRLHLLDSLSIAPHLTGERFIDVGTGGGLPGIPLAIVYPERHFTLLDSAGKKMRFLFQVKQELRLANVDIQTCRVETFEPAEAYDGVISRAFASLQDMTESCRHLLKSDGLFWAMKGQQPLAELSAVAKHYIVANSFDLAVPGVDARRCLIVLQAKTEQAIDG